jgi:hypothetical protein
MTATLKDFPIGAVVWHKHHQYRVVSHRDGKCVLKCMSAETYMRGKPASRMSFTMAPGALAAEQPRTAPIKKSRKRNGEGRQP